MFFIILLGLSALLVAGAAAYFSVLGIAMLFAGSYYQVLVMAGSLELGKLVAASYLHKYWKQTSWWLKTYLSLAVVTLMIITSIGIFGYLSAAYQVNSLKFTQIDYKITIVENQKTTLNQEIETNNKRIEILNEIRKSQEERVQQAGNYKVPREQAYAAIEKANTELQTINTRNQQLQQEQFKIDNEVIELKKEISEVKDIGTFMFFANFINKPLDVVVIWFILSLMLVFDPLAVSLVLAFNTAIINRSKKAIQQSEPKQVEANQTTTTSNEVLRGKATGYGLPKQS